MDLLARVGILIVIIVVIFSAFILVFSNGAPQKLTQQQAVQTVLSDVQTGNPGAQVNVINVTGSRLENDSWSITLGVVYNATRPCPTLSIESYDYPATGLVPTTDNLYTSNCQIFSFSAAPYYVVSSAQIAMVKAHNSDSNLRNYTKDFGYDSVNASAIFYSTLKLYGTTYQKIWLVNYTASNANYGVYDLLNQSGYIVASGQN